ncbi:MAG: flagellar M-ring protein FliF [Betaproteobacteria bacterium]|nr:flagellar M-ring protein FliF [Betaproteobacteria bacterium]
MAKTTVAETASSSLPVPTGSGSLLGSLPRMSPRQILALMLGSAALIAVAVGAWIWTQAPDYRVLYSGLSDRDGGSIIGALNQMNVPYRFAEGGGAILVPADKVHDARLRLASQGLPKGSVVGFELVDNQKFGATQFQEQINYQRGLEGELARSIQSLSAVAAARVHLAIPKPSVFLREQQNPSASVLLTLNAGRQLDRSQVTGIINLVASSVPELSPNSVSVLDQNGSLLSRNGTGIDNGGLDPSQLSYIKQIETETIRRITDILEPIVGRNNARVQVTADVDFQRVESVAETFKPNQDPKVAAIRTQQLSTSQTSGSAAGALGIPGALSNQPSAAGTATTDGRQPQNGAAGVATVNGTGASGPSSAKKDEAVAYEVDKTIQHTRANVGGIKRLTAAIVVNHRRQVDKDGKATTAPLTEKDLEQVNALVREAMGFNKERGDSLNIVNTAFNEPERETVADVPFYKQPDNVQLAKDTGKYLLFALLIGYLYFGVLKPMMAKALESLPAPAPLPALAGGDEAGLLSGPADRRGDQLQIARKIAREDPKVVANVVKSWVTKDE